mgnify:FL=1
MDSNDNILMTGKAFGEVVSVGVSNSQFLAMRVTPHGTMDEGFNQNGFVTDSGICIVEDESVPGFALGASIVQDAATGLIGAAGSVICDGIEKPAAWAFDGAGALSTTNFGDGRTVAEQSGSALSIGFDSSLKFLVSGFELNSETSQDEGFLVKLLANENSDSDGFNSPNGSINLPDSKVKKIIVDKAQNIYAISQNFGDVEVTKYLANGQLDTNWASGGSFFVDSEEEGSDIDAGDIALDSAGNLLLLVTFMDAQTGGFLVVFRLRGDGSLDQGFANENGVFAFRGALNAELPENEADLGTSISASSDGSIYIGFDATNLDSESIDFGVSSAVVLKLN